MTHKKNKLGELFNFATDSDGVRYLIPLPEGEFQQVEQFARSLMSKLVSPEMLPESSKELIELAKLFPSHDRLWSRC